MNWRYGFRRCGPTQAEGCTRTINQTADFEFEAPSRFGPNRPLYKPEHWDKIQQLDMWTNKEDPVMTCQPLGIPRHGRAAAHHPVGERRDFLLRAVCRRRRRPRGISHHPDRRPQARSEEGDRDHITRVHRRPLGGRHAGARLHLVRRHDMARTRRFLPFRSDASGGEIHAQGQSRFSTKSPSRTPRCSWSRG